MRISFEKCGKRKAVIGVTLTEMAVVLGAVGIVLGGLWAVASTVWSGYSLDRTMEQVMTVAQSVRDYCDSAQGRVPSTFSAEIAYNAGIVPAEMRVGANSYKHGLGGTFTLGYVDSTKFSMIFQGMSKTDCVNMIMKLPAKMSEVGIDKIGSTAGNALAYDNSNVQLLSYVSGTFCNQAGKGNQVYVSFSIHN